MSEFTNLPELKKLPEPTLLFGYDQALEDPRDGLTLFGPLDERKPHGVRAGVIGTKEGIEQFTAWATRMQTLVTDKEQRLARPPFPGFESVFGIAWRPQPDQTIELDKVELERRLYQGDTNQRVYDTVDFFTSSILDSKKRSETTVDIWFVIVPDDVYKYCRPQSKVESRIRTETLTKSNLKMTAKRAKNLKSQPSMFEEDHLAAVAYEYDAHFRNQLKARLLADQVLTQIIKESTIAYDAESGRYGRGKINLDNQQSAIAWNLCTSLFYKIGGRPWKIHGIRAGVCYIGLVFKQDEKSKDPRSSCCAAQMFLDSGDGIVFKGAVGPWHRPGRGDYHLDRSAAKELIEVALREYKDVKGKPPSELFIHGKTNFHDEEWAGFLDAIGQEETRLVGVRIRDELGFKLYTKGKQAVLRGMALIFNEKRALLWTKGYTPRLKTYAGKEVPLPIAITITRGSADIEVVLKDILALTKLNYNACIHGDGEPVTLKFADAIGEVLTAGPVDDVPPLPFRFYI